METGTVDAILSKYPDVKGRIIAVLHEIQSVYKYLPADVLRYAARRMNVPITRLYSIATFYHFFSLTPKGRHLLHVCVGTACHVKGAQIVLDEVMRKLGVTEGGTTDDKNFTLDAVRCIGACSLAPVVVVDKDVYPGMTPKKVATVIKKYE